MLVEGGAGLNHLSPRVLEKMQIPLCQLRPTQPFLGATPGHTVPLGQISLMVTFGDEDNYRTASLDFDVAEFGLPYNGILGQPALAKFMHMVASHYAYMTIKMPRPKGSTSVSDDLPDTVVCAKKMYLAAIAKEGTIKSEEPTLPSPRRARAFKEAAIITKSIPLKDDPNRKACSSPFYRKMPMYLHGNIGYARSPQGGE